MTNQNQLYVICTKWPDKPITIRGIKKVGKVSMIGVNNIIKKSFKANSLTIIPPVLNPGNLPCEHA
uniref:hypothetical protein n=1 Tax=Pedobacter sp. FW305-3-2-15-E-R2A2 TaxID=3140251 RepID=UPI00406BE9E9